MHLSIRVMLHNIARVRGPVEAPNEVDEEEDSSDLTQFATALWAVIAKLVLAPGGTEGAGESML
jgi:hypothetical protein